MNMVANTQAEFNDASLKAAENFRLILDAMAHPGRVFAVPSQEYGVANLTNAAAMTLLTLCDHETNVWLDQNLSDEAAEDFLKFYCGCPLVEAIDQAMFAVVTSDFDVQKLGKISLGTPAYPDRSTTIIVQVETLNEDGALRLSGPGIKSTQRFHVEGLSSEFWNWRSENNKNFPLGTDVIFVSDSALAALPRTTQVREVT